ncbi:MAG: YbaK/EbsC family protein [bacterium]
MKLLIEKMLSEKGVEFKLLKLEQKVYTVEDVKKFNNGLVNLEEICKTIILVGKKTGLKIAVLFRGNDRLNFKQVKKLFGGEMRIADAEEVRGSGGGEIGAVCPFLVNIPLFVDKKVFQLEKINCGSGEHSCGLEVRVIDLEKISNFQVVEITWGVKMSW